MTSRFEGEMNEKIAAAIDFHVLAFSDGLRNLLKGLTVVDAKGEVWSNEGHWSLALVLSDGSIIETPVMTRAAGPLAELVCMAGGSPFGNVDQEKDAIEHGWGVG